LVVISKNQYANDIKKATAERLDTMPTIIPKVPKSTVGGKITKSISLQSKRTYMKYCQKRGGTATKTV
jgi:hypothetical protein